MTKAIVELEHFSAREVRDLPPELQIRLQMLRYMVGLVIHVTSGLRITDSGAHGLGVAVDIADNRSGIPIGSEWRHEVLKAAYALGFRRIGDYDKHIHLDIDTARDQDVTWWAKSKSKSD